MLDMLTSRAIAGEAGEDVLRLDAPERSAVPDSLVFLKYLGRARGYGPRNLVIR